MSVDLLVLIVSNLANFLLGIIVLARNPTKWENRLFGLLAFSAITWTTFNYLADNAVRNNLVFTRMTFLASLGLIYFLPTLARDTPDPYLLRRIWYNKIQKYLLAITAVITLSPYFVTDVTKGKHGAELKVGFLYYVFVFFLAESLLVFITNFYMQYRKTGDTAKKVQVKLLLTGTLLYAFFAILSNVVLPAVIDTWSSSRYGPVFLVFFVGWTGYAIVKHKLFDIRFVVARTIAYLLTVTALTSLYGLSALLLVNKLIFKQAAVTTKQQLIYVVLAVVLAFIFQPIKRFFDRFSNRFFYRDAYDLKVALDGFSSVLVANIDLNIVLGQAQKLVDSTIKPLYSHYYLINEGKTPYEFDSRGKDVVISKDIAALGKGIKKSIIVQDELTDKDSDLRDIMIQNEVSVIQKLETHTGLVGFAYLGAKKSGGIYNSQDVALLTIMGNELALAVQNALRFEEISQFNLTLQKKVDDATAELQQTNEKLRELDQAKDDFISMASHQLRTPLTSMKGYVSMVLDGDTGKVTKQQKEMLEQAFISSQRMVYLISDLLNVSRLRTGKFVIENNDSNLADVVEQEIHQLDETASAKNLKLLYKKPKRFPMVKLDETKIRQVVMNFADNAVYYTPKGGTITIEVKETPKAIEYTCSDNGIGVSKEAQKNLFTKFFRADNAKKARPDGTGLGLYMAKKVVVAQGGSLIFHSEEGKGSTFGFSLPKEEKDRPKVDATADEDEVAAVKKTDDKVAEAAGTKGAPTEPVAARPMTVANASKTK